MSKSIALLCIQSTDEGRVIADVIKKDNEGIVVSNKPAMIRLEREGSIVVKAQSVSEALGRDWETDELQLVLISTGGQIDEDDDQFVVYWNN